MEQSQLLATSRASLHGMGISCPSFPAPAPWGPQASAGGGGGGLCHALMGGWEGLVGYCLSPSDAGPARCRALQNHRTDKNTIKPVLLLYRGWARRPPLRWKDCWQLRYCYQQPCPHLQQPL